MADSLHIPGRSRPVSLSAPKPDPISPENGRIAMFALALTRSVGECDPYFCDGNDAGRFKCFFCGELAANPHLPMCGHATAARLVETGSLEDDS
jgi:hypothetical protein